MAIIENDRGLIEELIKYIPYDQARIITNRSHGNISKESLATFKAYYPFDFSYYVSMILASGRYATLLELTNKDIDDIPNGQGILTEKVYKTKSGKSAMVFNDNTIAIFQKSGGQWNMYAPNKGLKFPWVASLLKENGLPGSQHLSTMPPLDMRSSNGYYSGGVEVHSAYGSNSFCRTGKFTKFELLERITPSHIKVAVWGGYGSDSFGKVFELKVTRTSTFDSGRGDKIETKEIYEIDTKEEQNKYFSDELAEDTPYYSGDRDPKYSGTNAFVASSGRVWLKLNDVFLPVSDSTVSAMSKLTPHDPALQEYMMYKNLTSY